MSVWITHIEVPSYSGVTIRNQLYQNTGNTRLMVLLPGRGYRVTAPLLHYCFRIGWNHGYDVLRVDYGFHAAQTELDSSNIPEITQESLKAVEKAISAGQYDSMVVIGKSLGTPIAAMVANMQEIVEKCLLLTPIQNSHKMIESVPTLAVIGTADRLYDKDLAEDTDVVRWQVYDGLDHSLEKSDDISASISVLGDIIGVCSEFILGE